MASHEPRARLHQSLVRLYGPQAAQALLPRIDDLLTRRAASLPSPPAAAWTERDAFLITYPDQVRQPPAPPLAVLSDFCRTHLADVISGVHVLPFFPSSSDDGFSILDHRLVDPELGSWDDIHALARGFRLMIDAVVNHVSARGNWFRRFTQGDPLASNDFIAVPAHADLSAVVRPRTSPLLTPVSTASGPRHVWTTFSADQVDLNYAEPHVLLEMLDVLLEYAGHGAGLLRLDAVAFLWKEPGTSCLNLPQTHELIRVMRAVLDLAAPHVLLVSETNIPHAENLSYFGEDLHEVQMVYNFALPPLVIDAIARGSASTLTEWAASLSTPGQATTFFNCLASHDGIGLNPVRGVLSEGQIDALVQRTLAHGGRISWKQQSDGSQSAYELNINFFDVLSRPDSPDPTHQNVRRFMAAQAVMLALAGLPGIYFHSLFGSRGWTLGVEQTGQPRAINRQKLERAGLERELQDPISIRALVFHRFSELLRLRRAAPAFHPNAPQDVLAIEEAVFAVVRSPRDAGAPVLCLHNLSDRALALSLPPGLQRSLGATRWKDTLAAGEPVDLRRPLELAPYDVCWLCPRSEAHG